MGRAPHGNSLQKGRTALDQGERRACGLVRATIDLGLRALQATGLLTFTASGPVVDLTVPASKFSSFGPATDTGKPSNPGAHNCAGAP